MDNVRKLGPVLSAAAVVLSLGFVGLELRQNTAMVRGATMQSIANAQLEFLTSIGTDPVASELLNRVHTNASSESFDETENMQLDVLFSAYIQSLENSYLQHHEGLVSDIVFESYGWRYAFVRTTRFEEYWNVVAKHVVSPDFAAFFESRVTIGPQGS
jgi:hypothetical protein